jgi:hypothetical protein
MSRRIGFDRHIKLDWLDTMAGVVKKESDIDKIRLDMHSYFEKEFPLYEARRKTITVLLRIWYKVPKEHLDIRNRGLELLPNLEQKDRIWIHWGLILLAFPFVRDISTYLSRCFSLNDICSILEVTRKMEESWGYRTTMKRALDRVIQSFGNWDIIAKDEKSGIIQPKNRLSSNNKHLNLWLLEAILLAEENHSIPFDQINKIPSAFPFEFSLNYSEILESNRFIANQITGSRAMISVK